eukprot:scaffold26045_cov69-Phaeocystis_antarctica.AAC.2
MLGSGLGLAYLRRCELQPALSPLSDPCPPLGLNALRSQRVVLSQSRHTVSSAASCPLDSGGASSLGGAAAGSSSV